MKAYLGQTDRTGLRRYLFKDAIPPDSIGQVILEWSSPPTFIRAVAADDDANTLRRGDHGEVLMLLDREVEVLVTCRPDPRISSCARGTPQSRSSI